MAFKIYTKTGDKGQTALLGGRKVSKANVRIQAYGTVDELNAHMGYVADSTADENISHQLRQIQATLFVIGSHLSLAPEKKGVFPLPRFGEEDILSLENSIDQMDVELPPLKSFILPGGHPLVSSIHITRCVCRRAEREVVNLILEENMDDEDSQLILKYLNRLSDWIFVLARYSAHKLGAKEIPWITR